MIVLRLCTIVWLWFVFGLVPAYSAEPAVDFFRDVRPILSEHCFACHGPDDTTRESNLRLDTTEGIERGGDSGAKLLTPTSVAESELLKRVVSTDPDSQMPPASKKNPLSADQIATLRRWIEQGATYPAKPQWSFNELPIVPGAKMPAADLARKVDELVAAEWKSRGLSGSPKTSRETLVRRLALDLTGLPASVAEVEAFVRDEKPGAYERAIERFLASPHYGERMAAEWLDLARFADTFGYQSDVDCDMSPWRDWVIKAFNENLPYDQFISWQIAGDLLPNPTRDQYLATAFNRLHRQTNEGGSIDEEFRCEYVADRVHTFGTAFLGLTLECCRCHDHKYDPIKQRDYYQLSAFFNNIDESGLYSHFTRATPTPTLFLYPDGVREKHEQLLAEIAAAEKTLAEARSSAAPMEVAVTVPSPVAHLSLDENAGGVADTVDPKRKGTFSDAVEVVDGKHGKAVRFPGDAELVLRGVADFGRTDPFSFSMWLKPQDKQERAVILHRSRAWSDSGSRGYELVLDHGRPAFALIHFYPGNAIQIRAKSELPQNEWSHVTVTYDGSSRAGGIKLYVDGRLAPCETIRDNLYRDIQHRGAWGDSDEGNIHLTLAGRFRDSGFRKGLIDEFKVFNVELTPLEVAADAGANQEPTEDEKREHFTRRGCETCRTAEADLQAKRKAENDLIAGVKEIMVMREQATRRPTYVLKRGAYDARSEEVSPGVPEAIFPFPANAPKNRLGLARWLVDPRHPLTARVVVNRIWRQHFGRGLVVTQEDFGSQGQLPSHPALLDMLSRVFIESGWDVKALHRTILLSQTWQQSSSATREGFAIDPENKWLARGPRFRLSAEQIRDSALAVSGLLTGKVGGPSVKPYQPAGLWEESGTGKSYRQDKGDALYRRSMYTFWRRTAPPPSMLTFDAVSREVCTAKRESTSTPLQSLVLLNDPQFVEAARALAEAALLAKPENDAVLVHGLFERALGRSPSAKESEAMLKSLSQQRKRFAEATDAAEKYLAIGERPRNQEVPLADLAATTVVASTLLNHFEFVFQH